MRDRNFCRFLFFAAVNNLRGQEEISVVCAALIAAGTFSACYAVAQLTHNSNQVWNQISPYIGRASGTFISSNNLACLLALLLPLTLAYLLVGKVNIVTRILLAYAAVAMAAGLAVTFSRGCRRLAWSEATTMSRLERNSSG